MFMGLLPTWGDKVIKMWGQGPIIFTESNAYIYGKWLGNRYKDFPNIIWILGGDRPPVNDSSDKKLMAIDGKRNFRRNKYKRPSLLIILQVSQALQNSGPMNHGLIFKCFNLVMQKR